MFPGTFVYGFIQYVTEPTRKDSILDVVLSNEQIVISDCQTVASIGNSDHNAVLFKVMLPNNATYSEQSGTTFSMILSVPIMPISIIFFTFFLLILNWYVLLRILVMLRNCVVGLLITSVLNLAMDTFIHVIRCISKSKNRYVNYPLHIRKQEAQLMLTTGSTRL